MLVSFYLNDLLLYNMLLYYETLLFLWAECGVLIWTYGEILLMGSVVLILDQFYNRFEVVYREKGYWRSWSYKLFILDCCFGWEFVEWLVI